MVAVNGFVPCTYDEKAFPAYVVKFFEFMQHFLNTHTIVSVLVRSCTAIYSVVFFSGKNDVCLFVCNLHFWSKARAAMLALSVRQHFFTS